MKSILDPSFKYVPSSNTDIRLTFKRIRAEQKAERAKPPAWHAAIAADEAAGLKRAKNANNT